MKDLFVLDIANNHQGDVHHAKLIIDEFSFVLKRFKSIECAIKFQLRDLDSFIHPNYKNDLNNSLINRFLTTRLNNSQFRELVQYARSKGFKVMATPFDEQSIELLIDLEVDILKIASCSANDWPLIDSIVKYNKPVIASTGGMKFSDIDKLVFKLQKSNIKFKLMHCVSIYPTPDRMLELNQIKILKKRYSDIEIGFSTHEDPDNYQAIQLAHTLGATIFERHIGLKTKLYDLNKYSSSPSQISNWIQSYLHGKEMLGASNRFPAPNEEKDAISKLQRGVYLKKGVLIGQQIFEEDVFYSFPLLQNKLKISDFRNGQLSDADYKALEPLNEYKLPYETSEKALRLKVLYEVNSLLNQAMINIGNPSKLELSHHYGFNRFREFGAVIFDIFNREYCKKIIVMLPRQKHPYHRHFKKEETFQVLFGELEVTINGNVFLLSPGAHITIEREHWHKFQTSNGVIFEEISTTHFDEDSYYDDDLISKTKRENRKTCISDLMVDLRLEDV